jgi:hypothetical protein
VRGGRFVAVAFVVLVACGSPEADATRSGGVWGSEDSSGSALDCVGDGEGAGTAAGETAGHDAGYADAEAGEERGYGLDTTPDYAAAEYDPGDCDEAEYDDGYDSAYEAAYEAAYDEGYDEALTEYGDPTVENPYDEDCDGSGPIIVSEDDPNHYDADGDGIGCEG